MPATTMTPCLLLLSMAEQALVEVGDAHALHLDQIAEQRDETGPLATWERIAGALDGLAVMAGQPHDQDQVPTMLRQVGTLMGVMAIGMEHQVDRRPKDTVGRLLKRAGAETEKIMTVLQMPEEVLDGVRRTLLAWVQDAEAGKADPMAAHRERANLLPRLVVAAAVCLLAASTEIDEDAEAV